MIAANRSDLEAAEIARAHAVVKRQVLPNFVDDFNVRLGAFEGEPAMWIEFLLSGSDDLELAELERRASILVPLQQTITSDMEIDGQDRFIFYRVGYRHIGS